MWGIRAGIHKMLVKIANREDPDQTGGAVWSGSALFVKGLYGWQLENLEHLPYIDKQYRPRWEATKSYITIIDHALFA